MNTIVAQAETKEVVAEQVKEQAAVAELDALELALVGGGVSNVSFARR